MPPHRRRYGEAGLRHDASLIARCSYQKTVCVGVRMELMSLSHWAHYGMDTLMYAAGESLE